MDRYIKILAVFSGLFFAQSVLAGGATLFLSPASESYKVGEKFSVDLLVDTDQNTINAAQTTIYFPQEQLEVLKISKEKSIFTLWPKEPIFSNQQGLISFTGGLPSPGFEGKGIVIGLEFLAKKDGQVNFSFDESKVLANDGLGTNILLFIKNAKYLILPAAEKSEIPVFSTTHPNNNEWYSNNAPRFQWEITNDIFGVSFVLDEKPKTIPDTLSEGRAGFKNYENILDGIWYFHLRFENNDGWAEVLHYQLKIDANPPRPFEIVIDNQGDPTNPSPNLYFEAQDDTSGIDKYKVKIDDADFIELLTAQISARLLPGIHQIIVGARDKAYNSVRAETLLDVKPIESPYISAWPSNYIAGEETLYIEGSALPNAKVILYLKSEKSEIKKWEITANEQGFWSFSSKDLIKPGTYSLSAKAQDERGAESNETPSKEIGVTFSGLKIGDLMVSLRYLAILLIFILFSGILGAAYLIFRNRQIKKILKKETLEAKNSLLTNFAHLEKEVENKIGLFDLEPGLNEQERRVYENIGESLKKSRTAIEKEIEDIERELK